MRPGSSTLTLKENDKMYNVEVQSLQAKETAHCKVKGQIHCDSFSVPKELTIMNLFLYNKQMLKRFYLQVSECLQQKFDKKLCMFADANNKL